MKKIFLLAWLITAYFMIGLFTPVFAQIYTKPVYFYADSISTTVASDKETHLISLTMPSSRADYIEMQKAVNGTWYWAMINPDSTYKTFIDSTINTEVIFNTDITKAMDSIRFVMDRDVADTISTFATFRREY